MLMKQSQYVVALDQGTTSCRAIVFDRGGQIVSIAQQPFAQHFPRAGWVEHDATEIWEVQRSVLLQAVAKVDSTLIAAIGITNQRETTVVWDRVTGKPVHPAIVWQCRRTSEMCAALKAVGFEETVKQKTGLVLDPYFSGTKLRWLLDQELDLRNRAARGDILFGTMDSWLIWNLTAGKVHCTDYSNASRTMLYNIHSLDWDEDILRQLDIPRAMLPEVRSSSEVYGQTELLGHPIPVAGAAGDQQAALFGQACYKEGMSKNTYGTGCFLLSHTGTAPVASKNGLLTTIAWGVDGQVEYALEGSVFSAGSVIQWLRDGLQLIDSAAESESLAASVEDTAGIYFVPAFTGLGTPYWNPEARGMISGITRGATKAHLVRAALEAIVYQTVDVLKVMQTDSGIPLRELRVDGGASVNNWLMQFQADLLGFDVVRPTEQETTSIGAAYLAGLAVGFWSDRSALAAQWRMDRRFVPAQDEHYRTTKYTGWQQAVSYQT